MDVFRYALQFEKDGEAFYRRAASSLKDKNLSAILLFLAAEEQKHFRLIEHLKAGSAARPSSIFLSDIANIFTAMQAAGERFVAPRDTVTEILTKAMGLEEESIKYYGQTAARIDRPEAKALLLVLKKQEETHYSLLSSLIEYYETPHLWMEQAEFNNIKEY